MEAFRIYEDVNDTSTNNGSFKQIDNLKHINGKEVTSKKPLTQVLGANGVKSNVNNNGQKKRMKRMKKNPKQRVRKKKVLKKKKIGLKDSSFDPILNEPDIFQVNVNDFKCPEMKFDPFNFQSIDNNTFDFPLLNNYDSVNPPDFSDSLSLITSNDFETTPYYTDDLNFDF
eukprot:TRINITY_DN4951_c0_g1_i2.p1 TRINITY_DN4951_c0_g1~~TRINITY_DN4951_c0_g1_i2.p1  ORF type:complete len:171 (-),score=54.64 TRINITY_DN4951_c0_g1_i2:147-659(-)